ncbi:MAG: glycoside hydrolase family 2, partial [Phycisphaerales bacterium]|nr:glycoside hydrolase family 2 [Phycisphaerales bacterium]
MSHLHRTFVGFVAATVALQALPAFAQDQLRFDRVFAPAQGLVVPSERPLREELCLNGSWQFQPVVLPKEFKPNVGKPPILPAPTVNGWSKTSIRIPSPWNVNAFPYGANQADRLGPGGDFRAFPSYPLEWD